LQIVISKSHVYLSYSAFMERRANIVALLTQKRKGRLG